MEAIMVLEQSAQEAFSTELPEQKALEEQDIALSCEETLVLYDFDNHSKAAIPIGTNILSNFKTDVRMARDIRSSNATRTVSTSKELNAWFFMLF